MRNSESTAHYRYGRKSPKWYSAISKIQIHDNFISEMRVIILYADMVELADTQDLGSCIERCAGSSPVIRTRELHKRSKTHVAIMVKRYS